MLRRLTNLLFILLSLLLILPSCSKKASSEQPIMIGFSCNIEAKYDEMNIKGYLTRSAAGTLRFDIDEPETLNGLSMQWDGNEISIKLNGISFNVEPDNIPQSALGKCILGALDSALGVRDAGELTDEGLLTKGVSSAGEFEIISDPATGSLLNLKMPSVKLEAKFSDFKLILNPF
ncbi:MAG: hypothetical protein PHH84_02480 [Oscillospiraceae bacterium]|nr:hypothetical protein [Oscillospiraceae bacterium]MDD4413692.1 hypothetical protein [Oscillospiraceae bacterium]